MYATPCGIDGARLSFDPLSLGYASIAMIASSKYIFCVRTQSALDDRELIQGDVTLVLDGALGDYFVSQNFECVDYSGRRLGRRVVRGGGGVRGGRQRALGWNV